MIARGVYGVFLVTNWMEKGVGAEGEVKQAKNCGIVLLVTHSSYQGEAAIKNGVKHIVFGSIADADNPNGMPFHKSKADIEKYLLTLGIHTTFVRPATFYENWEGNTIIKMLCDTTLDKQGRPKKGTVSSLTKPETKNRYVALEDVAWFVVNAFNKPEEWNGKKIDLVSEVLDGNQIAEIFGKYFGYKWKYEMVEIVL